MQMVEQAGGDRILFRNSKPQEYVQMKFPEYVLAQLQLPRLEEKGFAREGPIAPCYSDDMLGRKWSVG